MVGGEMGLPVDFPTMHRVRDLIWLRVLFVGVWGSPRAELFLAFETEKPLRLRHKYQVLGSLGRVQIKLFVRSNLLEEEARVRGGGRADENQ